MSLDKCSSYISFKGSLISLNKHQVKNYVVVISNNKNKEIKSTAPQKKKFRSASATKILIFIWKTFIPGQKMIRKSEKTKELE